MLKQSFLLASGIYFFNSIGNVLQGVLIKYCQSSQLINLYEIITIKCLISAVIMFPFALKYLKHLKGNKFIVLFLAILYSCDVLFCNIGFKTVPINTGTLILLLIPLWVVVFGRLILKEKSFNTVNASALFVCLFAIYLTIKNEISFSGFNIGYIFLFLASIVIPFGLIMQKKFSDSRPVVYALFTNAVVLGIISFTISSFKLLALQERHSFLSFDVGWVLNFGIKDIIVCFFIAICDLVEFASVYVAYKMTEPALLQPIRFTRIFFAIVFSYFLLSEIPNKQQVVGAILIILANIFSIFYSQKRQTNV